MFPFTRKKSLEGFHELMTFIRNIPTINMGGCGIAALVLYNKLKELGHKNVEIVYGYRGMDFGYDDNLQAIKTNDMNRVSSCGHAFIKLDNEYFDCKGEVNINSYDRHIELPKEMVIQSLKKRNLWNEMFDREKFLPIIENKIGYKIL